MSFSQANNRRIIGIRIAPNTYRLNDTSFSSLENETQNENITEENSITDTSHVLNIANKDSDSISNQEESIDSIEKTDDDLSINSPETKTKEVSSTSYSPRYEKIKTILNSSTVDIETLKEVAWNGIPSELRPMAWQILMGYLPSNASRRDIALERKHQEYLSSIDKTFFGKRDSLDAPLWHQISIDIPRTYSDTPLFKSERFRESLGRVLYCWAIRNPASGYVQGINDLASIFYVVFISKYTDFDIQNITVEQVESISKEDFNGIEADCFWCLTNLIGKIHDSYTFTQPGIQRQIVKLKELVSHINLREFSIESILRIWDTYLCEPDGFSSFHLYTCAALLLKFSDDLLKMDFQEIVLFLQSPPSLNWNISNIEILLSEAFTFKSLYKYSSLLQNH
ncbi:hypothetical protein BB560_001489 [Smittium megazygosporum]|uniref:Rab-GAP TBC domain-containing protein n=1 Tax=Smittium megazygosporum TaxID=133381 RepID=A0A2T9ZHG4_9FUNG|nr:hypothetical protein BB560_001489 [Smittium megazygosporum]